MNKKQTVYKLINLTENINNDIIVKYIRSGYKFPLSEIKAFVFTEEELKKLLSDYTDKIVENAEIKIKDVYSSDYTLKKSETVNYKHGGIHGVYADECSKYTVEVDKESITNQLTEIFKQLNFEN